MVVHALGRDPAEAARVRRRDRRDDREEVGLRQRPRLARYPAERHLLCLPVLIRLDTDQNIFCTYGKAKKIALGCETVT